jgi:hypothetical protein
MSRLTRPDAARRPEEAALSAAPRRDVAVTTTVLALAALLVNELQRRWGAHQPRQPAGSKIPDNARRADRL